MGYSLVPDLTRLLQIGFTRRGKALHKAIGDHDVYVYWRSKRSALEFHIRHPGACGSARSGYPDCPHADQFAGAARRGVVQKIGCRQDLPDDGLYQQPRRPPGESGGGSSVRT
jgi:hypothetical protein